MIDFVCPHCKQALRIPEEYAGHWGTCNFCKKKIHVTPAPNHPAPQVADDEPSTPMLVTGIILLVLGAIVLVTTVNVRILFSQLFGEYDASVQASTSFTQAITMLFVSLALLVVGGFLALREYRKWY